MEKATAISVFHVFTPLFLTKADRWQIPTISKLLLLLAAVVLGVLWLTRMALRLHFKLAVELMELLRTTFFLLIGP